MPRKIFHFDVNGTIIAVDSVETGNDYENTNMTIARSVFGKEIDKNGWIINEDCFNQNNSVSYYDYLKKSNRKDYKKESYVFTEKDRPGEAFRSLYDRVLPGMSGAIFESFMKVSDEYPDALIVLRTFGKDISAVVESLMDDPKYSSILIGRIDHVEDNMIISLNGKIYVGMKEINDLFAHSTNHIILQEDYNYWNDHSRDKTHGKTIQSDPNLLQFFFDDNECVNIIGGEYCHYIKVNTVEALVNENYFVNHIRNKLILEKN